MRDNNISFENNTPEGQLVINDNILTTFSFHSDLQKLLNLFSDVVTKTKIIPRLNIPNSHFIHCDLMDRTENLLNGEPSNLLANFQSPVNLMKKIDYVSTPQEVFRDLAQV